MKLDIPRVISGTSLLGNLYKKLSHDEKKAIVKAYIDCCEKTPMFDSAGKYGAGLALEALGKCLKELDIKSDKVLISNKLAWVRKPLTTPEPTFERGIWHNVTHDAEQQISYKGIIRCFEEGNELLNGYAAQMVSVHDPDEYLAAASSENDYKKRYEDILNAYRALADLKHNGLIKGVGIGAKDWRTIEKIAQDVKLDWVMIANQYTIYSHSKELINFIAWLTQKNIAVINSAVFHGGFLMGSDYFNYLPLNRSFPQHKKYYVWRDAFFTLCKEYNVTPAAAAIYFALHVPGIKSIALNSSHPQRVQDNIKMAYTEIPVLFWQRMKEENLIDKDYPYL